MSIADDILLRIKDSGPSGIDPCVLTKQMGLKIRPQGELMGLKDRGLIDWKPGPKYGEGRWIYLNPAPSGSPEPPPSQA